MSNAGAGVASHKPQSGEERPCSAEGTGEAFGAAAGTHWVQDKGCTLREAPLCSWQDTQVSVCTHTYTHRAAESSQGTPWPTSRPSGSSWSALPINNYTGREGMLGDEPALAWVAV